MCAESSPIAPEFRSPARTETPEQAGPESARKRPNRAERSDHARRRGEWSRAGCRDGGGPAGGAGRQDGGAEPR